MRRTIVVGALAGTLLLGVFAMPASAPPGIGHQIVTQNYPDVTTEGWRSATCPTGKVATGGAAAVIDSLGRGPGIGGTRLVGSSTYEAYLLAVAPPNTGIISVVCVNP